MAAPNASPYLAAADQAAAKYNIPVELFRSLVGVESQWNPYAISPKGAYGLAQLMPGTAQELGVNQYDTNQNLEGGAKYLSQMFAKFGNWRDALAAYNGGPGNYNIAQTQAYAEKVLSGAGMTQAASNPPPSGNPVADWISNLLYGQNPALTMQEGTGQIVNNSTGEVVNAPQGITDMFAQLFTWAFWQGIFTNTMGAVAVIALLAFGVFSLLNQAKAVAK